MAAPIPVPGDPAYPAYAAYSIQPHLMAINLATMVVALVAVLGRVYIRAVALGVFGLDDYFIVVAMVFSIISCAIFIKVVHLGLGKHFFVIPPQNFVPMMRLLFTFGVFIPISVCFVKLSISFFLLRLTKMTRYRQVLWGIVVFLVIFTLMTFLTIMFSCIPMAANWDFTLRPPPFGTGTAECMGNKAFLTISIFNNVTNIITDIVLALIPVPLIWTLQVNKRTKASLIIVLGLGFFACATAIIKTPYIAHFFDDPDFSGKRSLYYAWQIIEMNVGIIVATLPALKPAFRWLLETTRGLTSSFSGNRSGPRSRPGGSFHKSRKHSSLGYFQHDSNRSIGTDQDSNGYSVGKHSKEEVELKGIGTYVVGGERRKSSESSDAILTRDLESGRVRVGELRGIVKTTRVTMVTE